MPSIGADARANALARRDGFVFDWQHIKKEARPSGRTSLHQTKRMA
jgi:hypothetical protein